MTLNTIFNKPVDRPIEGVIKADDDASLRLEIEEYVLTNEVEKRLESFLDAYINYEGANGVWISGFFGSGKSHLLKILALLLENRKVDGTAALDLFLTKCDDNEILRGDLKRAVAIPSRSILFNIDQKADVISKTQTDALLAVFVKVFDETCGYYGKQPYIAQFERELDRDGLLEDFKREFESAGEKWEWGRRRPTRISDQVDKAYNKVTGQSQHDVLDKFRQDYHLSIEDFAEQVNSYIEQQSTDFRLNFFVDEVGQYIAENIKLMTNLQTIAESLATRCRGRAWVIVTAQEEMGTVVGEMGEQQGKDFSKIQARFDNRLKLTSADVAEVIQKRLLQKNEEGIRLLSDVYHKESNNFKTLFDFADGSQTYRNFRDRDHFIHSYPFIPYQFTLFQSAIQNLSQHSAFEGQHSSVGERSMLSVFQQVAIQIEDKNVGQLATFDLMYEGIRSTLKSQIQRAISQQAEKHLVDRFAVRLLKALFLVKYIKEFKPTIRNLCVLMLDNFNQDLPGLRKQVEEALNLLEQQTYVQRNGDLYEFLTDEEKDVEQEIKNTEVDTSDVAAELEKIVFDQVIKHRKIRYNDNSQDYPFSKKLDDRLHGREYELTIHVISPFHEHAEDESTLTMQNMGRDELLVIMPADERLVRDLLMYKRTDKYIRQNLSITLQEAIKRILNDKRFNNQARYEELVKRVKSLMSKTKLFVAGANVEIGAGDAQERVIRGFYELISCTYPNLRMLRGICYTEEMISTILSGHDGTLFGEDATTLAESEQELLAFIQSNNRGGVRTTLKNLLEKFERKPYGWYYAAVLCTLANLCARGKVEVRVDGNLLENDELERALRNTHGHGNMVLEPQVEFTASQVRALKEFMEDFFDSPPGANEARALGKDTGVGFKKLLDELIPIVDQVSQYPFLNVLIPAIDQIQELIGKPYTWYLTELRSLDDTLLDMKENLIDPIRKFMSGPQREIFENASKFIQDQDPNFTYIEGEEADQLVSSLTDSDCFKGNRMQQVKLLVETLQEKINTQIDAEINKAKETVIGLKGRLESMAEFDLLNNEQQDQIILRFNEFNTEIERQKLIAVIRDTLRRFTESEYPQLLAQLSGKKEEAKPDGSNREAALVTIHWLEVPFSAAWLADEADVDRYLESMREVLLEEIRKGKRIQV